MYNPNHHLSSPDIILIGLSGFPFGSAAINKCLLICKALDLTGSHFRIINNQPIHKTSVPVLIEKHGSIENIEYFYTTPSPYRPDNFIVRNFFKIIGPINELFFIARLKFQHKADIALLYLPENSFPALVWYRLISVILRFPVVMHWVELSSSFPGRKQVFRHKVNDWLFERYCMYLVDGILPISDYLTSIVKTRRPSLPWLKVPALGDFEFFSGIIQKKTRSFVFCGSAAYMDIIEFIIRAFESLRTIDYTLILVVNGNGKGIEDVTGLINESSHKERISHHRDVSYEDLQAIFSNAAGLLIPLRPTLQDKARFPQKIAEYVASGNPVITTGVGEITKYFTDMEDALIASEYNVQLFAEKMQYVIDYPELAIQIGKKGKVVGQKNFDYKLFGNPLISYIKGLIDSKT